ncbi:polysaccharide biosynthesis protein [Telmatocola sphagniphila]|uniref:Polysaccharide biosynthesis protein n=1 Tax=Telmatocola sphagniphila TaxID=1123043 RepID=A0A8E6B3S1_9BACT|nr:polysaccharide biosynthesis protein [Telmatocola sphagniphila]QVL31171.1 polysaccharide biosynthesis protein [Telmatocola sphagniphila]
MDRYPILFRCDADSTQGWENLYQTVTFASSCQRQRRPIYIMGGIEPFPLIAQVARNGNEYLMANHPIGTSEDCDETIRAVRKLKAAGVVVAGENIQEEYLRELASTGTVVTSLTNTNSIRFPSRLIVNPFMEPGVSDYDIERGTQLCIGKRYAIVRGIFRRQRAIRPADPQGPFRAILAFGDDDFNNQTVRRATELLNGSRVEKVSAFARFHYPQMEELKALASRSGNRLEVLTEPGEWATRLTKAHFAVTGGCSWALELACVGVPQLIINATQKHRANSKRMDEEGAAIYLGEADNVSELMLRDAGNALLDDPLERAGMSRCGRNLIDGRGLDRMVAALEIMLHSVVPAQKMRLAA